MKTSDTLTKIAPALVAALSKIEGASKTAKNPAFKTKYANLEAVIEASRDVLTEHELTIIQLPGALVGGVLTLETVILHTSGEFISGEMGIALGKQDPQGVGSALTYARRYAQMAALNMPALDDDGEAAMGRGPQAAAATSPPVNLLVTAAMTAITVCDTTAELKAWHMKNADMIATLTDVERAEIIRHFNARKAAVAPVLPKVEEDPFRSVGTGGLAGNGRHHEPEDAEFNSSPQNY